MYLKASRNVLVALLLVVNLVHAEDGYMGQYQGQLQGHAVEALVIAQDPQFYRIALFPEQSGIGLPGFELQGFLLGETFGIAGYGAGRNWTGIIEKNTLKLDAHYYGLAAELKKIERQPPSLGQRPPAEAVVLLAYQAGKPTRLDQWENTKWKLLDDGSVQVKSGGNSTRRSFGDVTLHLEFRLPLERNKHFQNRANSGVFLNEIYEVQVLDSFGQIASKGDCGAIYDVYPPRVNASLPPEIWQCYDIIFTAPRVDDSGRVKSLPRMTVKHNGVLIQDDVEIPHPTANTKLPHEQRGPLSLQDHGSRVCYRNIWLVEN